MNKLLFKGEKDWKGTLYNLELYQADSYENLEPVTQAQAVPFIDDNHIVIYKHIEGYYGLPGGSIETGESFEEALKREVWEESACEIVDCALIGYMKNYPVGEPSNQGYQLRYWAEVTLSDEPIQDPCGKAVGREVVTLEEAVQKLNWGENGRILIELSAQKYKEYKSRS